MKLLLVFLLLISEVALAGGKKRQSDSDSGESSGNPNGKLVIQLPPIEKVTIELPDGSLNDFGEDFRARLTTYLEQTGRYVIIRPAMVPAGVSAETSELQSTNTSQDDPLPIWPSVPVPAATLKVNVEAMSFSTGFGGERMFYGFDENFRTPFNDGSGRYLNEFPLRTTTIEANWFDRTFDQKGDGIVNSRTGLDLGDGFDIDVLFAWLSVKYALYHSRLNIRLDVDAPLAERREFHMIDVRGEGYFYDVAGAYQGYSGGIGIARRDAMDQAFTNAVEGSFQAIERAVAKLPLTGRVDHVLADGTILLGTGTNAEVKPGTNYEVIGDSSLILRVKASSSTGAIAELVCGSLDSLKIGQLIREKTTFNGCEPAHVAGLASSLSVSSAPASYESVDLPATNFEPSDLKGNAPSISRWVAFLKSLTDTVLLPYRIWRYYQYDQAYHKGADGSVQDWAMELRDSDWARRIGLSDVSLFPPSPSPDSPVVAVIDSGVDYNHSAIHDALWLNPKPTHKDRYGWDYISNDHRAYDDGYHGTWIASSILAVDPSAKIIPLKVFNPWGITSSAAIYGAFAYAVDHGAKIIVCGWATRKPSKAVEMGVSYARDHGVLVVAAAGDRGDDLSKVAAYPASLARKYDNVVAVTAVDDQDQLVQVKGRYANYDPSTITIAAPGQEIHVAEPRDDYDDETSTGISAALTAGALARIASLYPQENYHSWVQTLKVSADSVPNLRTAVSDGLRLKIRF